jgi:hypothetical protein
MKHQSQKAADYVFLQFTTIKLHWRGSGQWIFCGKVKPEMSWKKDANAHYTGGTDQANLES